MNPERRRRIRTVAILAALTAGLGGSPVTGQTVVRHPDAAAMTVATGTALVARWQWAIDRCADRACVVGYRITRRMRQGDHMGQFDDSSCSHMTVGELVTGVAEPCRTTPISGRVRSGLDDADDEVLVEKPVALLFRLEAGAREPSDARRATFDSRMELDGAALVWIGAFDQESSLSFVIDRYENARGAPQRQKLVWSVGLHQQHDRVVPWLTRVARSAEPTDVRRAAVFSLGDHPVAPSLTTLQEIAGRDDETEIRRASVFAMANLEMPGILTALRSIIRADDQRLEVRKAALFAVADVDDDQAFDILVEVARSNSADTELRKAAIYSLADVDSDRVRDVLLELTGAGGR